MLQRNAPTSSQTLPTQPQAQVRACNGAIWCPPSFSLAAYLQLPRAPTKNQRLSDYRCHEKILCRLPINQRFSVFSMHQSCHRTEAFNICKGCISGHSKNRYIVICLFSIVFACRSRWNWCHWVDCTRFNTATVQAIIAFWRVLLLLPM